MKNIVCGVLGLALVTGVAKAQDAAEMFNWKLQPPVGLRGRYTTFTHMKIAQNLPAMPAPRAGAKSYTQHMEIETQQTLIIDYETISRDLTGGTVSRLTYRTLTQDSSVKINGKPSPSPSPQTVQTKALENMFDGLQIDIKQGPDGRVWNVQGIEKMRRRLDQLLPKQDAATKAMMKPFFDSIFNEKTMRQSWDVASKYPQKPVRVGESWKYQTPFEMAAIKMNLRGTRQLIALESNLATITERANLSLSLDGFSLGMAKMPGAPSMQMPQIEMSGNGVTSGKSIVDRTTGLEIETFGTLRMATNIKIKSLEKGRSTTITTPQWSLMQTHRVFKANPKIEAIE